MTKREQQRFAPHGALAVHPKAFGALFDVVEDQTAECAPPTDGVAIVPVRGPLMNHEEFFFDSYASIKRRVAFAIESGARTVLLDIDSPGGLVHGAFDTSRELRRMCAEANVELRAHVTAQATSAAYAIATAASVIGVAKSATIGSIGVIDMLVDETAMTQAMGINVQVVTSGERKADGNPNVSVSDGAVMASQSRVNELAEMFFDLVVDHGWAKSASDLDGLQAGVFTGDAAASLGLVTAVATLAETIALEAPAGDEAGATETRKVENTMAEPMEDAVASLRSIAEGEDEEEANKAKAALRALGAEGFEEDDDEEKSKAEDEEEKEAKAKAEDEEEKEAKAKAEDEEDDTSAKAAHAVAMRAMAEVHNMKAAAAQEKADAERAELLASRPDFAPELVAILSDSEKTPLATVRQMCADLKKGPARAGVVAAAATATGTRGATQGDENAPRLAPEAKAKLDRQMGLTKMSTETVNTPFKMTFGARRPVTAAAGKEK